MLIKRQEGTMREPDKTDVLIVQADRLNNSTNGNPRFEVTLVTRTGAYVGTYRTATDASCNFEVTNYAGKPRTVDVWLSKRGTVEYLRGTGR